MQLEIPQDIVDIVRECQWEHSEYTEMCIDLSVSKDGKIVIRDMIGCWDELGEDRTPTIAWQKIRTWWANEEANRNHFAKREELNAEIKRLQKQVEDLDNTAKKRKWFW